MWGMACSIHFLLPAAFYLATKFEGREDHFEQAVLHAINSGGNNMARAALTGECSMASMPCASARVARNVHHKPWCWAPHSLPTACEFCTSTRQEAEALLDQRCDAWPGCRCTGGRHGWC